MAYTAFGERCKGDWRVSDPLPPIIPALTNRGFTGHEHIDEMGLIHMNGRVYDPQIGRFLSTDPYIQSPYNTQSYNRYSYTINNPLKYTHPDGNFFLAFLAAAITKTIVTNIAMGLIAQMFVAYAVSYAVTYIATGSAKAAQGAGLGAALFMGIGGLRGGKMGTNGKMQYNPGWESGSMKTLAAHGLASGIVQDRMGGIFGAGFLSGSLGSYLGSSGHSKNMSEMIGNTARDAVVGGTISVIGGGKFANGAQTGAFRYLFNEGMYHGRTFSNSRKFKTQHNAAIHALEINATSISENREYGGLIYENSDGSYSFTGPIAGKKASVNPLNAPAPNGANVTAYYHTHGAYDPKYDSEIFSDTYDGRGDIPFAKSHEIDGYLATPSGKIKYYNYVNDTITRLQ